MPGYTANNGTPFWLDGDTPDIGAATAAIANSIEKKIVGWFPDTATRDSVITGATTGVNPPGPTVGQMLTLGAAGAVSPQIWDGTAWQSLGLVLPYADCNYNSTTGAATGGWTRLQLNTTAASQGSGVNLASTTAIQVAKAGRYAILSAITWPSATDGRRGIGLLLNSATAPTGSNATFAPPPSGSWTQKDYNEITLAAGDLVAVAAYHDSATSTLAVAARLVVRRLY